ncbi:F-box protein PP2-B15 [Camellia lanceoleosa]|uniref:F-box protein PP2-B15 n=1 Tax=Camellia lanceoleosa TaxID=1840588 RepID=A0ACC0GUA2_9ERIC|nr:F-box protein PP2-B15 [Camellia lanceoleosa]
MKTGMLSPKTTYAAYLIFEIMEQFSGLESIPVKVSVRFVGEMEVGNGEEDYGSTVYLRFQADRPVPEDHNIEFLKREKMNRWR